MKTDGLYDDDLVFDEDTHTYSLLSDVDAEFVSATALVHSYSRPFNTSKEAEKYAIKHGREAAEVLAEWEAAGELARTLGTRVHAYAEQCALDVGRWGCRKTSPDTDCGYSLAVATFYDRHPELFYGILQPEARICDRIHGVAGSVDLVGSVDGIPSVVDFKTSQSIDWFSSTKMYSPINHLPDRNAWHYAMQLSVYATILRHYDYQAEQLIIVHLGSRGTMREVRMPYLQWEAEEIIQRGPRK